MNRLRARGCRLRMRKILFALLVTFACKGSQPEHSGSVELSSLETTAARSQDDPPPPEEEAGGTGTAMALDEGKMGKKDSDRAEGPYKLKGSHSNSDPALARGQYSGAFAHHRDDGECDESRARGVYRGGDERPHHQADRSKSDAGHAEKVASEGRFARWRWAG